MDMEEFLFRSQVVYRAVLNFYIEHMEEKAGDACRFVNFRENMLEQAIDPYLSIGGLFQKVLKEARTPNLQEEYFGDESKDPAMHKLQEGLVYLCCVKVLYAADEVFSLGNNRGDVEKKDAIHILQNVHRFTDFQGLVWQRFFPMGLEIIRQSKMQSQVKSQSTEKLPTLYPNSEKGKGPNSDGCLQQKANSRRSFVSPATSNPEYRFPLYIKWNQYGKSNAKASAKVNNLSNKNMGGEGMGYVKK